MAKVTINGEVFDWDPSKKPMSEALAIEEGLKCRYVDWETDLQAGSAKAMCGLIWQVWKRNGRDVPLADIVAGKVDIDLNQLSIDLGDEDEPDPTGQPQEPSPSITDVT